MKKKDLEIEATCLAWEQNCSQLAGDAKGAVALWMDDPSILASDGVARSGRRDRLDRLYGQGRGCGVFDLVIPCEVVPGSIVENIPVSVKGCSGSGYGNRDVTMHHESALAHAKAGRALWVFLVKQEGTRLQRQQYFGMWMDTPVEAPALVMRRIDASRVIREAPDCWKVRTCKRSYRKADGTVTEYSYLRLRIEWARVNKRHPHLFHDADWTEFSATLPDWPY